MKIEVADYNPDWPELFEQESVKIKNMLKDELVNIFHIGSTAVPGLAAKPILDIMPVVKDIKAVDLYNSVFESLGYEAMGELDIPGRRYFRKGGDNRTHQLHAFQYNDTHNILRHLVFRDYLREHPAVRDEYAALKFSLAGKYPDDIDGYCAEKDNFVKATEQKALTWFWENFL